MDPPPLPGLGGTGYQLKQMVGGVTPPKYPRKRMENANFEILKKLRKMKIQIMNDEII